MIVHHQHVPRLRPAPDQRRQYHHPARHRPGGPHHHQLQLHIGLFKPHQPAGGEPVFAADQHPDLQPCYHLAARRHDPTFTVYGTIDDISATIKATYVGDEGFTNTFTGLIERNGNFWFDDLVLPTNATLVTITASDIWTNLTITNFTVSQTNELISLDPIDANALLLTNISVSGSIDDPDKTIWVNGVQGTNNGDGTWNADNVPVNDGSTAVFYLSTYAAGDGLSTNAAYPNANPASPNAANSLAQTPQLPRVFVSKYHESNTGGNRTITDQYLTGDYLTSTRSGQGLLIDWQDNGGGTGLYDFKEVITSSYLDTVTNACQTLQTWPPSHYPNIPKGTLVSTPDGCTDNTAAPPTINLTHESIQTGINYVTLITGGLEIATGSGEENIDATVKLFTGGKAGVTTKSIWSVKASATGYQVVGVQQHYNLNIYGSFSVPSENITLGELGAQDPDGLMYVALENNKTYDITPKVSGSDNYDFSLPVATPYPLVSRVNCAARTDPNAARLTLGVGENVSLGYPYPMPGETHWSTSAGTISPAAPLTGSSALFIAPSAAGSATVTATVRKASTSLTFSAIAPTGIIATIRAVNSADDGVAGAGMSLDVILQPETVSFGQLQIEEIGEPTTGISGYFSTHTPSLHSGNGANQWHPVGCDNLIGDNMDNAFYIGNFLLPQPWSPGGSFTWPIPATWRVGNESATNTLPWSDQVFTLSADGTFKITKFGHSVTRTIHNVITTQ